MARRCGPRHARHCSPAHADLVANYRDARDAVDALRESGTVVGAGVACYQLEPADFRETVQSVTFKQWLIAHRRAS